MRILAVGMLDSVHFAKWAELASRFATEIVVMASGPHRRVHPKLLTNKQVKIHRLLRYASLPLWVLSNLLRMPWVDRIRAGLLAREVRRSAPDLIHIHEMQSGGYPLVSELGKTNYPVIYTPYGSDMFWFSQFQTHRHKISRFLSKVSLLIPECDRDVEIARRLGYRGLIGPNLPASGYFDLNNSPAQANSKERMVLIKGYGGKWGLAPELLRALSRFRREFDDVELAIYSATADTIQQARRLIRAGFKVTVYRKFELTQEDVRALMLRAQVHVGVSRSDGQPASFVEAVLAGCIPIQTRTACLPFLDLHMDASLFPEPDRISEIPEKVLYVLNNFQALSQGSDHLVAWAEELSDRDASSAKLEAAYRSVLP